MSYFDYRTRYRAGDRDAFLREFAAADMPCALAQSYAAGRAGRSGFLTMDDVLNIHRLCVLEHLAPSDLLEGDLPMFKTSDDSGCKAEDAHALTADFVQEVNAFGRNNPMFYAAYLMGTFCRISPFERENLPVAAALCNFYLVARDMPPIVFSQSRLDALQQAVQEDRESESLVPIKEQIAQAVQETVCMIDTEVF